MYEFGICEFICIKKCTYNIADIVSVDENRWIHSIFCLKLQSTEKAYPSKVQYKRSVHSCYAVQASRQGTEVSLGSLEFKTLLPQKPILRLNLKA